MKEVLIEWLPIVGMMVLGTYLVLFWRCALIKMNGLKRKCGIHSFYILVVVLLVLVVYIGIITFT